MKETLFRVPKMDCPSEERLIRLAVDGVEQVKRLDFDLDNRRLTVTHSGEAAEVLGVLDPLGMGAAIESTVDAKPLDEAGADPAGERHVLWALLAINGAMFVGELGVGFLAQSTGLIADSLDMLADSMVYGLSLLAVGRAATKQRRAARLSGWVQMLLAAGVLTEVGRRAVYGSEPAETLMIGTAVVALVANLACVALLAKHRKGGVHLRASWIFSTNDALANLGVIVAGALVAVTSSAIPDLIIGTLISLLVFSGAVRILRLGRPAARDRRGSGGRSGRAFGPAPVSDRSARSTVGHDPDGGSR